MRLAERILRVALTDKTFALVELRGGRGWSGKCLHCRSRLLLEEDGAPISRVTIEHIVPRAKGGTDDEENLGLACARCNHQKGVRIDALPESDPRYRMVIEKLQAERRRRWRPSPAEP